jgi:hypothetical protein
MSHCGGHRSLKEERVRAARDATRWLLAATLAGCVAVGAWAPVAGAATVAHDAGEAAAYTAADGELNRLQIGGAGALVEFFDAVAITAPDPASPALNDCIANAGAAYCPAAPIAASLGDGDDTLTMLSGAPAVTASGGAGADVLLDRVRSPATVFDGGEGLDRADYSGRAEPVSISLTSAADDGAASEGDTITDVEDVSGGGGDDAIAGDAGANGLSGGPGNDGIDGAGGNDVVVGGTGGDTLNGGDGDDQLVGGAGADSLSGGNGADVISAADGVADTIDCGGGADTADADRGAGGVTDVVLNCETVTGPVAGALPASRTAAADLVTVRAPGVANPADLTPPAASLRTAIRQRIATVRVRGVSLRVACTESCGVSAALALERTAARRLGLARSGGAVMGTAKARRATPGAVRLRVKLNRRARTALRRTRRLAVTVQVLVSDASGNGTLLQRRIALVR